MNPATILYRLGTLVSEGYTTLAEAESLAGDRQVFEAWLLQRWSARHRAEVERMNANPPAPVILSQETRAGLLEYIRSRYGTYAAWEASEQGKAAAAEAAAITEKYRIKTVKEVAAWWREKRKAV